MYIKDKSSESEKMLHTSCMYFLWTFTLSDNGWYNHTSV